jgi:uncharacterized hydrophobic protein (TIGR00341 family)
MRFIKANFPADKSDAVIAVIEAAKPIDWSLDSGYGRFEKAAEIVVAKGSGQKLLDDLQNLLGASTDWRVTVLPIEASIPRPPEPTKEEKAAAKDAAKLEADTATRQKMTSLREELYQKIEGGCKLNLDFIVLTVLSTIVAAIGLNYDNVAIVIAAMVIAPLLGPILAFSLATALGDLSLMWTATKTALSGLGVGFVLAAAITLFMPINVESVELMSRTIIGPEVIILALASGAAAALSMSTGLSSALVGVMVAVALLPPSVASAIFLGIGDYYNAAGAALLLGINVVCAVLSAQLVFVWKGVRPRSWIGQQKAAKAVKVNAVLWVVLLAVLILLASRLAA